MPSLWIVAATGESLTSEVASKCFGHNVIAVNDAYRLLPFAKVLYAADAEWWKLHKGCPGFPGEKVSTFGTDVDNDAAKMYNLHLIPSPKFARGFCFEPGKIHRGGNSGFQAVNLALQRGGNPIVLVGFDMKGSHFFGEHPPFRRRDPSCDKAKGFVRWRQRFTEAAELLPEGIKIINATPGSALTCFPMMSLDEALDA